MGPNSDNDQKLPDKGGSLEFSGNESIQVEDSKDVSASSANATDLSSSNESASDVATDSKSESSDEVDATGGKVVKKKKDGPFKKFWHHFNIYIVLFILLVVIAGVVSTLLYLRSRTTTTVSPGKIGQQSLSSDTLQDLAKNGVQVGDPKQVLNIQSNSVFNGAVLVKGEIQAAGGIKLGTGNLAITDVNVGNSATINNLQSQTLGVAGSSKLTDLSVLRNLTVNGSGSFNGGITTPNLAVGRLQLNGDLTVGRHIAGGGATPGRSNGSALGNGGTTTVSGSDTAGSVTINTGSGPAAGCFLTVNFVNGFASTPHVIITPVGSAAASLNYYINRTTANFSICSTNAAPANTSFGFDYHALD